MTDKFEQTECIKFCVRLVKTTAGMLDMLRKAFGDISLGRSTVFEWHVRFKSGRESIKDDERTGRPTTSKTNENVEKFESSSLRTVAEESDSFLT